MMNDEIRDLLPFYVAGTLSEDERKRVEEAMVSSEELQEEIEFQIAFRAHRELSGRGHPAAEHLVEYAAGEIESPVLRRVVRKHLDECAECLEAYQMVARTFPSKAAGKPRRAFFSPAEFLRSLKPTYMIPAVSVAAAVVIFLSMPDAGEEWEEKMKIAENLANTGDLAGAEQTLEEALTLVENDLEEHAPRVSLTLERIGQLREKRGKIEEALVSYERALAARQIAVPEGDERTVAILESIGAIYEERRDYPLSDRYHRHAAELRTSLGLDSSLLFAEATLPPQPTFRAPSIRIDIPLVRLDSQQDGVRMNIVLPHDIADETRFISFLAAPNGEVRPLSDTFTARQRRLTMILSDRYFKAGSGEYLLLLREEGSGPERDTEYRFELETAH